MPSAISNTKAYRASPPTAPPLIPDQHRAHAEHSVYLATRERIERRRQLRGLLLLAAIILFFSILRAHPGSVFPQGWWRLW